MPDDLTKPQKQEYNRWRGYANALLIGLTVIFAGSAIASPDRLKYVFIASTIFGLIGIAFTICWFTLESSWRTKSGKPMWLIMASLAFGCQVGTLIAALLFSA